MSDVVVVIGPGSIGQAIARRVSAGKHVVLADLRQENADAAADALRNAGFDVSTATVDVSSRESVHALVETADGLRRRHRPHPRRRRLTQPSTTGEAILAVDLYGTAVVLEEFGTVIARGGAGVVIASQSGHRLGALTAEQDAALATTPADELLQLPDAPARPGHRHAPRLPARQARQLAARDGRSRSMGQARRPHQHDQPRHHHHPARQGRTDRTSRRGLPAHDRALPCSGAPAPRTRSAPSPRCSWAPTAAFITGSDFLIDGGVTASYFYGELSPRA